MMVRFFGTVFAFGVRERRDGMEWEENSTYACIREKTKKHKKKQKGKEETSN